MSDDDTEQLNVVLKRYCHPPPPPVPSFPHLYHNVTQSFQLVPEVPLGPVSHIVDPINISRLNDH